MTAVKFTGVRYTGFDNDTPITFDQPGHYQVSEAKAAQLASDFPGEFVIIQEGKATSTPVEEKATPAKKAKKGK